MATASQTSKLEFTSEHEPQREFVTARERYVAFISGIGAGKTVGGIGRLLRNVYEWNVGHTGFVVAPTVPSLRTTIIPELEKWGVLARCEFNRTEKRLNFPNGSTVFLDSADNDRKIQRLRGPSIGWFWMDEAATIDKRAWDILIGRLREGDYLNAFVTTTPKGYNWLYDRFVDSDDATVIKGVPSHANPHLPDEYGEITAEYEGSFYDQEVLGEFTDFEGLVYPWFADDHLCDKPPETYNEVIYGVDWGHNNPGVVLAIVRDGKTWVVADEVYTRRMTVNDHVSEADRLVETWGEGPLYCDPSEPANIDTFQRNGLAARGAENDVTPGIQHVSSLRNNLKVVKSCQNVRNEFNQYQYKDEGDDDKPVKQHDHACFIAGTMVLTETGERPIETIRPGDRVLTRDGYRPVLAAGKTAENAEVVTARLTNGRELTGTPDHPAHTQDGFKPLLSLHYGDLLTPSPRTVEGCQTLKQSNTRISPSDGTRNRTDGPTVNTTAQAGTRSATVSKPSTARSGKTTTGRYLMGTSSTTRTAIPTTTTSRIWSVSRLKSTPNGILNGVAKLLGKLSKPRPSGTEATKGGSGTASTAEEHGKAANRKRKPASSAAISSSTTQPPGSARTPASPLGGGTRASATAEKSASSVAIPSRQTNTKTRTPVRVVALGSSPPSDVFNLSVYGQHEYFANGVLVSNCDALRYALFTHAQAPTTTVETARSNIRR